MKLKLYYVTNRNHLGKNQFAPDGYGIHPSSSGIENLRLGKVTVDTGKESLDKWLDSKTGAGKGDGVALSEFFMKHAKKHAKIVAYQEKIPDPGRAEATQEGKRLGSEEMFAEIQKTLRQGRDVLIYVHGFNVSWWDAVGSALALKAMLNHQKSSAQKNKDVLVVLFTWPSDGSALPFAAYRSDRTEAIGSGFALGRGFLKLRDFLTEATRPPTEQEEKDGKKWEPCLQNINVLCHSMGNYVLQHALQRIIEQSTTRRLPRIFDNVFLCSPDVDDNVLETDQPLNRLPEICRNISVYYNRGDLALRGSDITKGNPDRLGTNGTTDPSHLHPKVSQIDCSDIVDGLMEHSYYLKGRINTDIRMSLDNVAQEDEERARQQSVRFPNLYTMT
jgi:esterase/lipase superfamily enzyme